MTTSATLPLEQIAIELDKGEDRDPAVMLDLLNQHYISNGTATLSHLDEVEVKHPTRRVGNTLDVKFRNIKQMQDRLVELGMMSSHLADYSSEGQNNVIQQSIDRISTNFSSFYLDTNNPHAEMNRRIFAKSKQMKDYIQRSGIFHLDEINPRNMHGGLGAILGLKELDSIGMKERLVELGIFSPNLEEYTPNAKDKAIENIIANIASRPFSSFYLREGSYLETNRKVIATLQQFKTHLSSKGINHLDNVDSRNPGAKVASMLGFDYKTTSSAQNRLVELGTFSTKIEDYSSEVQREIIMGALNKSNQAPISFYFSDDNPHVEYNRKFAAASGLIKDHLTGKGILSLDDIFAEKHATKHLSSIIGFKQKSSTEMRERLVELEIFSPNLSYYTPEVQEKVIKDVFKSINKPIVSFYLQESNPFAEANRKLVATSQQMKGYLQSKGVNHLDDVHYKNRVAYSGLATVLGSERGNHEQMKQRLDELGTFSPDLSDSSYDYLRNDISQKLIDNVSTPKPSYYTSADLDEKILQSNREIVLASKPVQIFFAEQRYDMNDPSTMNSKVRQFFRKYLGTEDVGEVISWKNRENLPQYRRIHKEWSSGEEEFLLQEFEKIGSDENDFITMLNENYDVLQEMLGVSYQAIIQKCKNMGLISSNELEGSRGNVVPVYAFPSIHTEEFPGELAGFENYAMLLANGVIPGATPVFAFKSATHEQFDVVTLPIWYKGVDPSAYTRAEQAVLSSVQHYISNNSRFQRKENWDMRIDPSTPHEMDPRIIQIDGEHNNLSQLIFRKRFNPDNKIGTTAIDISHGRDIYVFQHEMIPTYQNTRV